MPPPPPAAKAPSFVLSARTVIVPSLSLFLFFGVRGERENSISKISTSLLLLVGENFSLFKKRALDSRFLSLSSS